MLMIYDSYTDTGDRPCNEDSVYVGEKADSEYLFVIADGLGGHGNGDVASKIVTEHISRSFESGRLNIDVALSCANDEIQRLRQEHTAKCMSTIALLWHSDEGTVAATVGDTRVYAFRNGDIVFQSVDHSGAQLAVAVGEITPSQIRGHEDRNILTRAVGADESVKVDIRVIDTEYDALLLCSDGFWEHIQEAQMCAALENAKTPSEWLSAMRRYVIQAQTDEKDNNSAIAAFVEKDNRSAERQADVPLCM